MAKQKEYANIIDAFLEDREPDWKELGLKDAVKSGETQLKRTHDYIDGDVLEEISESVESHHTMLPAGGKGGKRKLTSLEVARANSAGAQRDAEQKLAGVPADWARHSHNATNEDSVLGEALHSIEESHGNSDGLKKAISDEEVTGRIDKILGSGLTAEAKQAALKKLGEIELFNRGMATEYLNNAAPQMGINYLQPNAFMDKNSPTYEREMPNVASKEDEELCTSCDGGSDAYPGCSECHGKGYVKKQEKQGGMGMMASYKFAAKKAPLKTADFIEFAHESDESVIKVSTKTNSWSHIARGGSVAEAGTGPKTLRAYLQKKYGRGLPVQAGQVDGKIQEIGVQRTLDKTASKAVSVVGQRHEKSFEFDSGDIERLHLAGQTLPYIYKFAEAKVGEFGAAKALNAWLSGKKKAGEIVLPQIDVNFLRDKLGFKGASVEKQVGKAGALRHKGAENEAVVDGHKILAEYDLQENKNASDINTDGHELEDVEIGNVFGLNV